MINTPPPSSPLPPPSPPPPIPEEYSMLPPPIPTCDIPPEHYTTQLAEKAPDNLKKSIGIVNFFASIFASGIGFLKKGHEMISSLFPITAKEHTELVNTNMKGSESSSILGSACQAAAKLVPTFLYTTFITIVEKPQESTAAKNQIARYEERVVAPFTHLTPGQQHAAIVKGEDPRADREIDPSKPLWAQNNYTPPPKKSGE